MGFVLLLVISAMSIAGCAAYFSIFGLASVFSGTVLPVIFMGASLELGKLVTASFLYRFWNKISNVVRGYLIAAILVLMVITSMGIFGFLSMGFENKLLPYEQNNQQITLLEGEKTQDQQLKTERLTRQEEINKQIANLPNNYVYGRKRLIAANKPELTQINKDVEKYTQRILDITSQEAKLKSQTLEETAHVGPIIFMAQALGLPVSKATMWLIMMIIFVFDPLAVMLTIGTNLALVEYNKKKEEKKMNGQKTSTTKGFAEGFTFEPSDPPVYNEDRTLISSKDGMSWAPVAPHAAAVPNVVTGQAWCQSSTMLGGAAPAPGPYTTITVGGAQEVPDVPPAVKTAFDVFTKSNLSPQEKRMKEEVEALLKRHQEVLDANVVRSKS